MREDTAKSTFNPAAMIKTLSAPATRLHFTSSTKPPAAMLAATVFLVAGLAGCAGLPGTTKAASTAPAGSESSSQTGRYAWSSDMRTQLAAFERASNGTGTIVSQTADQQIQLEIPNDISFDVNRSAVKPVFAGLLTRYAAIAKAHPGTVITIVGHTDSSGSVAANNALSRDRAQSTRDYLIARGVAITRLQTEGRGSSEPIADNGTPEGRAKNRRVTIYVAQPAARSAGT
ncbi:MAG TPA: OmpA family protein [Hydrogenophaga sp.]|nr:OmpA family protein [Hydrogenophaga sp.]